MHKLQRLIQHFLQAIGNFFSFLMTNLIQGFNQFLVLIISLKRRWIMNLVMLNELAGRVQTRTHFKLVRGLNHPDDIFEYLLVQFVQPLTEQ